MSKSGIPPFFFIDDKGFLGVFDIVVKYKGPLAISLNACF